MKTPGPYTQTDFFTKEPSDRSTFVLQQIDVYNWGPFNERHCAKIDPKGTALIGPTGSGKTTLVDALMTLITAQPKYNLASTGGHESDRDLMSYIRGVSGAGNRTDNSHVARPNKTITGISASFSNGIKSLQIGAIFWINGPSTSASDRKDLWIISEREDQDLDRWLTLHHEGGTRALKQFFRETEKIEVEDIKKKYLVKLRRFFEVGDNAFNLLNRAAGLKQLNSIDEIFRELVLDDRSAFNRAAEVAKEFDDLSEIYNEIETARKQHKSLLPIQRDYAQYQKVEVLLNDQMHLGTIVPIWFALAAIDLWQEKIQKLENEKSLLNDRMSLLEKEELSLQDKADTLKDIYLKLGGNTISQLEAQIKTQKELVLNIQSYAEDYQKIAKSLGLDQTISSNKFKENQLWATGQSDNLKEKREEKQKKVFELVSIRIKYEEQIDTLKKEVKKIEACPDSNIDSIYQDFRSDLVDALNVDKERLPFVAELIEVKKEESQWRGAIERALGGHRLRILVPTEYIQSALKWINNRNNRLHVRLLEAKISQKSIQFFKDGMTCKLNFKKHPLREPLKGFLASIDRHCVNHPEDLRHTSHGMTIQGLMSGVSGRFEKQDHIDLNKNWKTGFDNKDRLFSLHKELADAEENFKESQKNFRLAEEVLKKIDNDIVFVNQLVHLDFEKINLPGVQLDLSNLNERLETLINPNSDTGKARSHYEKSQKNLEKLRQEKTITSNQIAVFSSEHQIAIKKQKHAIDRSGKGLKKDQLVLANKYLPSIDHEQLESIDQVERDTQSKVTEKSKSLSSKSAKLKQDLVRHMGDAKNVDTGALNEVGRDILDIPVYLETLQVLTKEALPEKLNRFMAYLNQSSDQGVTQLLADIENEVTFIEERLSDLNETLKRVDFQPNRYLQLLPQRLIHHSLRELQSKQRHLRSATLKDDEGESHYRALANIVQILREASDNKRTVGARALLDPRYRLQFSVSVLDRSSGELIETRTGSQGGSGGEKEIIASYILTASLSYALCPEGMNFPLFGTIVLDEAFSKSSQVVASRIISALREFGLHTLFVTPNKEMRLLREHTRSAILVHRKQQSATLTSLSWEELNDHAQKTIRKVNEVTL